MRLTHHLMLIMVCLAGSQFGCAPTPTGYHALDRNGGYQDFPVAPEEFIVEFRGNEITAVATVKDYMFYRCAELTKEKGFDTFEIVGITEAPFTPPFVPGMPPPTQPAPGYIAQIHCGNGMYPVEEKVYKTDEVLGRIGPSLIRK